MLLEKLQQEKIKLNLMEKLTGLKKIKTAVFISGAGSNLKNIIRFSKMKKSPISVNLIIYKKALYNSEFESENNLIKILNPIINSESIWRSHALYLMAEYFYSKNQKQKAKEFFNKIISYENSNQKIKTEAQKKLNRDFSE